LNISHQDYGAFLYEDRPEFGDFRSVMCQIDNCRDVWCWIISNAVVIKHWLSQIIIGKTYFYNS